MQFKNAATIGYMTAGICSMLIIRVLYIWNTDVEVSVRCIKNTDTYSCYNI